jgi:hypothetical protein
VHTPQAKLGNAGSTALPRMPPVATWSAGMSYEVTWTIEANHAGGYLYRLAPADGPLTEAAYNKIPLDPSASRASARVAGLHTAAPSTSSTTPTSARAPSPLAPSGRSTRSRATTTAACSRPSAKERERAERQTESESEGQRQRAAPPPGAAAPC